MKVQDKLQTLATRDDLTTSYNPLNAHLRNECLLNFHDRSNRALLFNSRIPQTSLDSRDENEIAARE